jgi:hypothetical protein
MTPFMGISDQEAVEGRLPAILNVEMRAWLSSHAGLKIGLSTHS